jgi:hypothetical protein
MPCPYANALGVPDQGVHAQRIFGLALNDILMTICLAFLTSYILNIEFWSCLLSWLLLGEFLHYYYGTKTAFLKMIGLEPNCND